MTSDRVRNRRDIVAQLAFQGLTPAEIAQETGQNLNTIRGDLEYLSYFGVRATRGTASVWADLGNNQIATIAKLASEGKTRKDIAAETGIPYHQVCALIRRNGLKVPTPPKPPEYESQVEENRDIRRMVEAGFTSRQIAVALGPRRTNMTARLRGLRLQAAQEATIMPETDTTPGTISDEAALALRAARHLLAGRTAPQAAALMEASPSEVRAAIKAFHVREALAGAKSGRERASA